MDNIELFCYVYKGGNIKDKFLVCIDRKECNITYYNFNRDIRNFIEDKYFNMILFNSFIELEKSLRKEVREIIKKFVLETYDKRINKNICENNAFNIKDIFLTYNCNLIDNGFCQTFISNEFIETKNKDLYKVDKEKNSITFDLLDFYFLIEFCKEKKILSDFYEYGFGFLIFESDKVIVTISDLVKKLKEFERNNNE